MSTALRPFPFVWPRALRPGGTIGVVSPAGPSSPDSLSQAAEALTARGYRVVIGEHAAAHAGTQGYSYLAGDDTARIADLNRFLRDPAIDLLLCARGGYGCARILDQVDYAAIINDPKPVVGYSDITALSLGIAAQAQVVSFSGIMATAGHGFGQGTLDPQSEASFWQAVGARGGQRLAPLEGSAPWTIHRGVRNGAPVTGPVYPVCLSLLTALLGTPYLPDLTGALLVIEDVHEELYAVDRMLTQLRLSGVLEKLSALLIGSFNGTTEEEDALLAHRVPELCLAFTAATVPVASGIDYGHIRRRLTLPVGAAGTVDLDTGTFAFPPA